MQQNRALDRSAFRLVVIAASAGGVSALPVVLAAFPRDFPLPVVVVQHVDPHHPSLLADILGRRTAMHVRQAIDHDVLAPGVVLVAPPGHHLEIVADGGARLTDTAPVHFSRPSADRLFESAARSCGVIIGVILTGAGMDGAAGAVAVRAAGGHVIVQDRATSACFGMPRAAIDAGAADDILPLQNIGPAVLQLARNGYDGYSGIAGI